MTLPTYKKKQKKKNQPEKLLQLARFPSGSIVGLQLSLTLWTHHMVAVLINHDMAEKKEKKIDLKFSESKSEIITLLAVYHDP